MPPGGSSDVWKYFRKVDKSSAKCKVCFKVLKSSGNTSNLMKHLKVHSKSSKEKASKPNQSQKSVLEVRNDKEIPSTSKTETHTNILTSETEEELEIPNTGDDAISTTKKDISAATASNNTSGDIQTPARSQCLQLTLAETFRRASSFSAGGMHYELLIKHILYFIAVDNRPIHLIKGKGFQRLMKFLAPNIKLPSEDTLKRRLDDIYDVTLEKYQKKIRDIVQSQNNYLATTADIWSEMMSTRSFLGVTIHYLDLENDEMKSKILTTKPLDNRHTATNITEHLEETIEKFEIKKENISAAVKDNGANMVAAMHTFLEPGKHLPCFAHTINRVVENILKVEQTEKLVKKVRETVKFFKNSVVQTDLLKKKQGPNYKKLILDVQTRWNSTFYMLERYIQLRSIVNEILLENPNAPDILTAYENKVVQKILLVLQPFEYVTRDICGEKYATTSKIIPTVNCLKLQIKEIKPLNDEKDIIEPLKECAIKELNARFGQIEQNHILAVSTILDPRFKNLHFTDSMACARSISFLKRNVNADDSPPPSTVSESTSDETNKFDFWSPHRKLAQNRQSRRNNIDNKGDETSLYLASPVSDLKSNPFEQWAEMKAIFPKLYSMACKYLIIPGTSVPSERLFSKAGALVTAERNRLAGTRVDKLLFMSDCSEEEWGF